MTETKTIPKRPPKPQKVEQVEALSELLSRSKATILTDYRGLTVTEITDLRRRLQANGAEYHVVKNTLFRIACGEREAPLAEHLEGPIAVAFALEDPVTPAKTLFDFIREKRKVEVRAGLVDGMLYDTEQVRQLSQLPSRDQLIAQVVGAIQSPISGFVGTLQGILNEFVWTVQAIQDQKSEASS